MNVLGYVLPNRNVFTSSSNQPKWIKPALGHCIQSLITDTFKTTSVGFSRVYILSSQGRVAVWGLKTGDWVGEVTVGEGRVEKVSLGPEGRMCT